MSSEKQLFITMVLSEWKRQNTQAVKLIDSLPEDRWSAETAPGRNRGIYLIGHLIAVSDRMIPLLGLGERLYPQLDAPFLDNPDRTAATLPSPSDLKSYWKNLNKVLDEKFAAVSADDWFNKHNSVSSEDFAKEPHRNKLNVVINRTNHLSYHLGQLAYLKQKEV